MSSTKSSKSPQDNILCCPICMDVYKTPRMLPCQHTLCESCLHSYIVNKSRERVLVSDFPCPVCRTSTPAPRAFTRIDTWSSLFPLNHLLVSLLDSSFHEMLEKRETPTTIDRCTEHTGKVIEFFCVEHDVKLCSKCFKNSHRQCEVLDIEEHTEFTSRFTVVKTDVDNLLGYLGDAICHIKTNIEQLATTKDGILTEMKDFRGKVDAMLDSFETDVKDQANVQYDGEVVVLKAQCEKYEQIKAEVEAAAKCLSELPVATRSIEVIATIENEIKSQSSFIHGCHSNIKVVKLDFVIENQLLTFISNINKLGIVNISHFESNLQEPPELVSRGGTSTESLIHSPRNVSREDHSLRSPIHHASPRGVVVPRQPAGESTTILAAANTEPRPHRTQKEPKRPKTVPIESTSPTPVVRPRPERPDVQGMRYFLPRSCSSPVRDGDDQIAAPSRSDLHLDLKDTTSNRSDDEGSVFSDATNDNQSPSKPESSGCGTEGPLQTTTKPPTAEKPKHRVWHYVNCMPGGGDLSMSFNRRISDGVENGEGTNGFRYLFRNRSSSASSISPDTRFVSNETVISEATRTFQMALSGGESTTSPVYENTSACSNAAMAKATPKTLKFEPLTNSHIPPKQCTKLKSIPIRVEGDSRECTITGSVELPDKRIILIDCNNSRVKLFSSDFASVCQLDMSKEPWNVASISEADIAVTVPLEKTIHIIRVLKTSMSTQRRIVTRKECWGIVVIEGKLVITTKEDGNLIVFLDENGRELQVINFASRENPNILRPVSLTCARTDHVLYICCEGQSGTKGSLVRMSTRGDVLYVFTHKELDRPYSTAIDAEDNVYITAIRSANVLLLSEGGASVMTILSRELGLTRPQHIHVSCREEGCLIILTERRSDKADVYVVT